MVGAASPLVTVLMSVLFTRTSYNWVTWASMPFITGGLLVCVDSEPNYSFIGVSACVGAMVMRSAKSIVQAQLLTEKIESVTLLYYMAPYAAAVVQLMALCSEGLAPFELLALGARDLLTGSQANDANGVLYVSLLLALSGLNACFLNLSGFLVTKCTNAVTLQVLGSVKSALGIGISSVILGNSVETSQAIGALVCIVGCFIYDRWGGKAKAKSTGKNQ